MTQQDKDRAAFEAQIELPPLPDLPSCASDAFQAIAHDRQQRVAYVNSHTDDDVVDRFAIAMKGKLALARAKGRSGWHECAPESLSGMLRRHVEKGDPRDVANFCMFLWSLRQPIFAPRPAGPVAYLRATDLDRLAQPHVSGCASSLRKEPAEGFIAIFAAPQPTALVWPDPDPDDAWKLGAIPFSSVAIGAEIVCTENGGRWKKTSQSAAICVEADSAYKAGETAKFGAAEMVVLVAAQSSLPEPIVRRSGGCHEQ